MTFAMQELPGEFTSFKFPPGVPSPFNMAAAILGNTEMLTLEEKLKMVPGLLPMLIEGQDFIDAQDELSVLQFMEKYGMPKRINEAWCALRLWQRASGWPRQKVSRASGSSARAS